MSEQKTVRIGELLTRAGVLRKQDLGEAILIAQETGQMIGKVLIMSGYITKDNLQAAVEAQALVRDNLLEFELALLAISTCARENLSMDAALDQLGWHPIESKPSARLGELLLASGVITIEHLDKALEEVRESITPLGAVLIKDGVITREILDEALKAQVQVREGSLLKSDAVTRLSRFARAQA